MPDWQKLVSHRLTHLALSERERQEVVAELAGHLEETFGALRRDGLPERVAVHRTLSQVTNWSDLQRKIYLCTRKGKHHESTDKPSLAQLRDPGRVDYHPGCLGVFGAPTRATRLA